LPSLGRKSSLKVWLNINIKEEFMAEEKIKKITDYDIEAGDIIKVSNFEGEEQLLFEAIQDKGWTCDGCVFQSQDNRPEYFSRVCKTNKIHCQNHRSRSNHDFGLIFRIYKGI
jgi:hypothetical protein